MRNGSPWPPLGMKNKHSSGKPSSRGGEMSILHRPHLGSWPLLRALEVIIASADLILIPLSAASVP